MDKIWLIVQREYITRVRKKSFIIMTFVGPLLMSALFVVPIFLMQMSSDEKKIVTVADAGGFLVVSCPKIKRAAFATYTHLLIWRRPKRNSRKARIQHCSMFRLSIWPTQPVSNYLAAKT
ncbi:hypothetical protein [Hymenobacter radiodurans]|uniref:hypothetical protein n=1 Tax=Hymenobacter radiodurans TaxID=2496028 RepID=UPI001F1024AA|nr:hypothetical protein [Hymenobacter radiodurans]